MRKVLNANETSISQLEVGRTDILVGSVENVNQTCHTSLESAGNVSRTFVLLGKVVRLVRNVEIWEKCAPRNEGQR